MFDRLKATHDYEAVGLIVMAGQPTPPTVTPLRNKGLIAGLKGSNGYFWGDYVMGAPDLGMWQHPKCFVVSVQFLKEKCDSTYEPVRGAQAHATVRLAPIAVSPPEGFRLRHNRLCKATVKTPCFTTSLRTPPELGRSCRPHSFGTCLGNRLPEHRRQVSFTGRKGSNWES